MKIKILPVYTHLKEYIAGVKSGLPAQELWEREVVAPYWDTLCCYAPMDLSARKPVPILDMETLEAQLHALEAIDLSVLQAEFDRIAAALPTGDGDPLYVALYPGDHADEALRVRENGVRGTSLFGNMLLKTDPLAPDFLSYIPYVFAHEYHHSVWGNYHYVLHPEQTDTSFLTALLIDGEADSFAHTLYPQLRPAWLYGLPRAEIEALWQSKYAPIVLRTDVDYETYMFGNAASGIPWCAGYAVGFAMVQDFLTKNPVDVTGLLTMPSGQILRGSGWKI